MGTKDSTPQSKLPRATLEQKIKILDYYQKSQRPQLDTVEKFKDEVAISTSTFNEWVKNQAEYRERYQQLVTDFQKNAKRKVKYKYDKINRAMDLLVQQKIERGEAITEPILRGYWQVYAHQFGVDNPKRLIGFSHGWLSQFKKRHGLSRKKDGKLGEMLLESNDNLLTAAVEPARQLQGGSRPDQRPHSPEKQPDKAAQAQFQPQHTLSFPSQYPYFSEEPVQQKPLQSGRSLRGPLPQNSETESRQSLVLAMSMPMANEKRASAADIEKFIFSIADHFFHEHQYLYPQTVKTYQEFKSSFLSERLIDLRSSKEGQIQPQLGQLAQQVAVGASQVVDHGQPPTQDQLDLQTRLQNQMQMLGLLQNQMLAQIPTTAQHRSLRLGRLLKQHSKHYQKHKSQTAHGGHAHTPHQEPHGGQASGKHRYVDANMQPLPLPQLLSLHRLHPLARTSDSPISQNMSQLREIHQGILGHTPPPASGSFASGEARDAGLDEMFTREQPNRQYQKGQWPSSSNLRKIWEQNKIMLS